MKIGVDSHSAEREGDGNATYCRGLLSALLADRGQDRFTLFAANPAHAFYRTLEPPTEIVRVVQGGGIARLAFALGVAATRARVDCLHAQYFAPLGYRGPLVATVHDLGYLHVPEAFPRPLRRALRILVPRTLARASHVITDSEFSRRDIVQHYACEADKITVVPLAVRSTFQRASREDTVRILAHYGIEPGFVLALGRLNRRKNLERLMRACALLRRSGTADVRLVIAGKVDYGADRILAEARQPTQATRWVGLLPDQHLPAFYAGAGAFAYPSLFEGFGLPVLEAMACGTPVVASDRSAVPELVGDAGLLVDPEDVEALAAALARILCDHTLAETLSERGLERSRGYSWSETARRTLAVYRAVAGH